MFFRIAFSRISGVAPSGSILQAKKDNSASSSISGAIPFHNLFAVTAGNCPNGGPQPSIGTSDSVRSR